MSYLNDIKKHLESLLSRSGSAAAAIRGLDQVLTEHGRQLPPQLQHYLSQRSYDKALAWVNATLAAEGQATSDKVGKDVFTPPPGGCSGRRRGVAEQQ